MSQSMDMPYEFNAAKAQQLFELLRSRGVLPEAEAEAVAYALLDIAGSARRVYSDVIPTILDEPNASLEHLKDRIWDIREEFRHIAYHIRDGKLTDL